MAVETNDLNEAMGTGGTATETPPEPNAAAAPQQESKPKKKATRKKATGKKPVSRLSEAPKSDRQAELAQLQSGDECPDCDGGRILIVRTRRRIANNYRRRVWGCKKCRLLVRVEDTPISPSRAMETPPQPKPGSKWS